LAFTGQELECCSGCRFCLGGLARLQHIVDPLGQQFVVIVFFFKIIRKRCVHNQLKNTQDLEERGAEGNDSTRVFPDTDVTFQVKRQLQSHVNENAHGSPEQG